MAKSVVSGTDPVTGADIEMQMEGPLSEIPLDELSNKVVHQMLGDLQKQQNLILQAAARMMGIHDMSGISGLKQIGNSNEFVLTLKDPTPTGV